MIAIMSSLYRARCTFASNHQSAAWALIEDLAWLSLNVARNYSKNSESTWTSSTVSVFTPNFNFLRRRHRSPPSKRSIAGAPSRTASRRALGLNRPVGVCAVENAM